MNILLLETTPHFTPILHLAVRKKWEIAAPRNTETALEYVRQFSFQAIFVRIGAGSEGRFDLLKELRRIKEKAPIIALLSEECSADRARAWKLGVTICLTEPVNQHEVEMATLAAVRQFSNADNDIIRLGEVEMNLAHESVSIAGSQLKLTRKEFLVLEKLMLEKGRNVTREQLLNHLYFNQDSPDIKIIDVFICKLRTKLQKAAKMGDAIVTSWGVGYRMAK